jgi:hypothetical protein
MRRCDRAAAIGSRLQQILDWAGDSFEGMLVFDEAHEMAE